MPLKDYMEFVEPLALPCRGKTYELPVVGVTDAVTLIQALDPKSEVTISDADLGRILLGDTLEQMHADNVPPGFITKATLAAVADFRAGRAAAEELWDTVDDPKSLAAMTGQNSTVSPLSPPTDEANSTPRPASTSTTTSSPRSTQPRTKAAVRSRGSKSSSSGRSSKAASTPSSESTS